MRDIDKIDWSKVLLWLDLAPKMPGWRKVFLALLRLGGFLWRVPPIVPKIKADTVLCIRSLGRTDYDSQWESVCACIPADIAVVQLDWEKGFKLSSLFRLKYLASAYRVAGVKSNFSDRFLATVSALYCLEAINLFQGVRPVGVLAFSEMQPVENVLIQYFNCQLVPTATLQHGLYINYGAQQTVNRLNYETSCAQTFLAWGEETGQLIRRFNAEAKIVVCGAPQLAGNLQEQAPSALYVVFDADINCAANRTLLSIGKSVALNLGIEVVVCLHPRNKENLYDLQGLARLDTTVAYGRKGIVIGHTTTQLINLARQGKQVYKMKSPEPCNRLIPDAVLFQEEVDLLSKIESSNYPEGWAEKHIAYTGEDSISEYKNFFLQWCHAV